MWTKVENETIYPQDLTLLKYFKIRIHKSIFYFLYSLTYFVTEPVPSVDFVGCRQQLGSDKACWQLWGARGTRGSYEYKSGHHMIAGHLNYEALPWEATYDKGSKLRKYSCNVKTSQLFLQREIDQFLLK